MKVMTLYAPTWLPPALVRAGAEVVSASPWEIECEGPALATVPFVTRAKIDPGAIGRLRRLVAERRPDVIHAFHPRGLASAALALSLMSHPPRLISYRGIERPPSCWDPSEWIAFRHASVTLHACESDAVRAAMVRGGIPSDQCETIYNGVPIDELTSDAAAARRAFDIPDGALAFGTVAAIRPIKGIDLLLEAAIECAELGNVYWILIGPVRDRKVVRLARHPAIAERVRLLGFRRDAALLASGLDLFVMPSRSEGLCRALLEAMAQRVCPVVSDAGGMKEVVRHGIEGLVVPRENASALARAIRLLYHNPDLRGDYAGAARRRIEDAFTPDHLAQRAMKLYRRALDTSDRRARA